MESQQSSWSRTATLPRNTDFFVLSHSTGASIAAEDTGLTSAGPSGPHGHKGPSRPHLWNRGLNRWSSRAERCPLVSVGLVLRWPITGHKDGCQISKVGRQQFRSDHDKSTTFGVSTVAPTSKRGRPGDLQASLSPAPPAVFRISRLFGDNFTRRVLCALC